MTVFLEKFQLPQDCRPISRGQLTFNQQVSKSFGSFFNRPQKDESLRQT